MNPEQQSFIDYIASQPWNDELCHHVYADWLEEHDMIEEANRQRKYVPAMKWFEVFANKVGDSIDNIINAGHTTYKDIRQSTTVGDDLGFDARDLMGEPGISDAYWDNWEIVTGLKVDDATRKEGEVFNCCY